MIKAVIFDCFGVVLTDALQLLKEELVLKDPEAARQITDIIAANNRGLILPHESNERIAEVLGISVETLRSQVAGNEVRDEELLAFIKSLRPKYRTAMLSNIGRGSLAKRFIDDELEAYFDVVVASGEIGFAKPEAEAYAITAGRLGVRYDECVFTDDRENYCSAATSLGMHSILYKNYAQFTSEFTLLLANVG